MLRCFAISRTVNGPPASFESMLAAPTTLRKPALQDHRLVGRWYFPLLHSPVVDHRAHECISQWTTIEDLHCAQVVRHLVGKCRGSQQARPGLSPVAREVSPNANEAALAILIAHKHPGVCESPATKSSLALDQTFLSDLVEIIVVQTVGYRNVLFVPASPVIRLVAAKQNNCSASRVEAEKQTQVSAE